MNVLGEEGSRGGSDGGDEVMGALFPWEPAHLSNIPREWAISASIPRLYIEVTEN